ncbi:MAG TPA: hypothetical protein VFR87_07000 [Nocardioidaceae bacterium]|nr:hypothetical protein [Nocardioidaceae bacterium]
MDDDFENHLLATMVIRTVIKTLQEWEDALPQLSRPRLAVTTDR